MFVFDKDKAVCGVPVLFYVHIQGVQSCDVSRVEYRVSGLLHFCISLILSQGVDVLNVESVL